VINKSERNAQIIFERLIKDLKEALQGLQWEVNGVHLKGCNIVPFPKIPQAITAMLEDMAKNRIIPMLRAKYECIIEEGGPREYPDITVKIGKHMFAIDIKTARLEKENRISGFSLGPYTGYFLHPHERRGTIKYPYASYYEHIICGIIYKWDERAPTDKMVEIIDIIVQPKWRIASRHSATGTTRHIGSIKELSRLRKGKGDFNSKEEFEEYWRKRGKRFEERQRQRI